ncbi:MAG: ABC transporter substrate-binding protein [Streptosporangiaceae bacterium]
MTVGLLFPYSGPAASYGALFNKAVQAGMEVVKDRYGTAFTLKTIQEDSQNTAQGATTAMTALATVDNAEVVMSSGTAPGLAAVPIAKRYGIPLINGSAVDPALADSSGAIINLAPLANQQVAPLIPYAVQTKKLTRIAIIHTTDELGDSLDAQVKSAVAAAGGTVVTDLSVSPDLTNFSAQAALIAPHHPDAIYLADSVGVVQYAPIFSQFRSAGLNQTFLGFNALDVPQVMSLSGVAGTLLVDQEFNLKTDNWATTDFAKAWAAIDPKVQPTSYIVNYANAAILIGEAVHALMQAHQSVDSKSLQSELHAISPATIIGGTLTISANGTTNLPLAVYELTGSGASKLVRSIGG